ncbi:hypothetical protein I2I05_19675 [Hymenobacter sp. BT683]|uniref:Uncharacterized protein n=1 Tax=Hymenobacter jeongseonensis TaxID=2791027 RepID=A0ABS0IN51_9BACT|nr:hypothetical protein [Hymenobacter jeongseonensis]MBF9239622.1 hypothetical protein [Hymenobacter jeongseonensis]
MKTSTWKCADWLAQRFVITLERQREGQLLFTSWWHHDAVYTDHDTKLQFARKSFWSSDIFITKDGEPLGEIRFGLFGEPALTRASGELFVLSTSLWEQEAYWKTAGGETLMRFQQAALSFIGKGVIRSAEALPRELETLLVSSGVFAQQLSRNRTVLLVAMLLLLIAGNG